MNDDLSIIKKKYGEKMMHLCRELFSTLLEQEGLLSKLMLDNFAPSRFLYDDIIENNYSANFKNYIFSLVNVEKKEIKTNKTPKELLEEAGYVLYECKSEEDIQSFRKYYSKTEELCTFTRGNRLDNCYVFFAVKKNVDEIKRENFKNPKRQDEYGISVISIQFSRGDINTLSIKNRYNHTVDNPDATFSNNLENIIEGLTESFQKEYNLNINQNSGKEFELPGYVKANDGKYYKYNCERDNMYYCPNNIIIDNFKVKQLELQEYILLDDFILDLKSKKIEMYDKYRKDSFVDGLSEIEKISINKTEETNYKEIKIITKKGNEVIIELDKFNRIIGYKNNEITKVKDNFLFLNKALKKIELASVKTIGDRFLKDNLDLEVALMPGLQRVGDYFLVNNKNARDLVFPRLIKVGESFLYHNRRLKSLVVPKLIEVGNSFLYENNALVEFYAPLLLKVGNDFLFYNVDMEELELPLLHFVGESFLRCNENIKIVFFPKLKKVGTNFMAHNKNLISIDFPKLIEADYLFFEHNSNLKSANFPKLNKRSREKLESFFKRIDNANKEAQISQNQEESYNSLIKKL